MSTQRKYSHLNSELTMCESSELPITIHGVNLAITTQDDKISECRLTFQISPALYQRIDIEALFNLKPEIRTPLSGGSFQPSPDIQIEASLDSDLLPQLTKHAKTSNQAVAYLQKLSKEQPNHPLLSPYSWYGLQVKQQQEKGETGYSTVWAYFKPSDISQDGIDGKKLNEAMLNFTKELTNTNHSGISKDTISQAVEKITQTFEELTGNVPEMTEKVVSETIKKMTTAFEEVAEKISEVTEEIASEENIFAAMVNFFQQEDWQFQESPENQTLSLGFQGENGQCDCYAIARKEQQQMVFYSILPIQSPENKRSAVAEFITRANYGIIIGNFELDFIDGEIRYKTSIDVDGNRLSFTLIKQLVYANVTMMDAYLPGIMSVIYGDVSAEEAINQIELTPDIPQASEEQEQLLSVVPAENQQNLAVNPSSQPEIQQEPEKIPEKQSHILAKLTPDEIGQLHQALQMLEPYQRKQTQEISEKVKKLIITRLGDLATEVFDEAVTFFTKVKFPVIILKLIQRYAKMAGRTRLFIEQLKDKVKQYREPLDNSEINISIEDLEKLFAKIDKRLEELPTDKLLGEKELIYLLEIEQFNEQLAFFERLIKNLAENPETGLSSTQ